MTPETKRSAIKAMMKRWNLDIHAFAAREELCEWMLDAALAVIEAEAWQPIAEAPKHGQMLALWLNSSGGDPEVMVVERRGDLWCNPDDDEDDFREPDRWSRIPTLPKVTP